MVRGQGLPRKGAFLCRLLIECKKAGRRKSRKEEDSMKGNQGTSAKYVAYLALVATLLFYPHVSHATDKCESVQVSLVSSRLNNDTGSLETQWLISIANCRKSHARGTLSYELMCPDVNGQWVPESQRQLAWESASPRGGIPVTDSVPLVNQECRAENPGVEACVCYDDAP